jgi:hypothetical protein
VLHVQFGPSPLALGLLIPASRAAAFDVAIIGRPGDRSPVRYGRSISGPHGRLVYTTVQWFEGPSTFDDLPDDLRARIASAEPLLVASTLRDQIIERTELVERVLRARPAGCETVVLACENAPHRAYNDIAGVADETGTLMLQTVVNRMCIASENDSDGRRLVSAHPLGEWLIERPARSMELLEQLATATEVEIVDDISARHDRKLWMVNGAHQALALMARRANHPDLPLAARDPTVAARVSHIHAAMNDALEKVHPELSDNLDYAVAHVQAYSEHPDSINRVLGQFNRSRLASFFVMLDDRLGRPARICARNGVSTAPFVAVINQLDQLLANVDAYQDAESLRNGIAGIDPDRDVEAVRAYEDLLTDWMADQEIARRARYVEAVLAQHRVALSD